MALEGTNNENRQRDQQQQQRQAKVTVAYTNEPCRRKLQFINGKFAAQKPQTSSVQRRNERERNRVRLINRTFAALRASLPSAQQQQQHHHHHHQQPSADASAAAPAASAKERRRLSKVQVLRTAAAYIAELAAILRADDAANAGRRASIEVVAITAGCPAENSGCHEKCATWQLQPQQQQQPAPPSQLQRHEQQQPSLIDDCLELLDDLQAIPQRRSTTLDGGDSEEDEGEEFGQFRLSCEPESPPPPAATSCSLLGFHSGSELQHDSGRYYCQYDAPGMYIQASQSSPESMQDSSWQSWFLLQ